MNKELRQEIERGYRDAQELLRKNLLVEAARAFAGLMPALREIEDLLGQSRVLTHLAQIFTVLDQNDQALEFFREAHRLAVESGDQQLQAISSHQLGCLLKSKDPKQAVVLFQESRHACRILGDTRGETVALALVGEVEFAEGEVESGLRKMLQAIREMPELPEREELIREVSFLGGRIPDELFESLVLEQLPTKRLRRRLLEG